MKAILYAFLAAVFYAINIPVSKVLLRDVGPTTMAALLYLGAGIGIALLSLLNTHDRKASAPLTRRDMPFVGALFSFVLLKECLSWMYLAAPGVMVAGAALVVVDTLVRHHTHPHQHTFTHFHGGCVHTHTITHTRGHDHFITDGAHLHRHPSSVLERELVDCWHNNGTSI